MTDFDTAIVAARTLARGLIAEGIEPEEIANAYIVEALGVWQADVGENFLANELVTKWTLARDIARFTSRRN